MSINDQIKWETSQINQIIGAANISNYRPTVGNYTNPNFPQNELYRDAFNRLALMMIGIQNGSFDVDVITDKDFIRDFFMTMKVNNDLLMHAFLKNEEKKHETISQSINRNENINQLNLSNDEEKKNKERNRQINILEFRRKVLNQIDPSIYNIIIPHNLVKEFDEIFADVESKYDKIDEDEIFAMKFLFSLSLDSMGINSHEENIKLISNITRMKNILEMHILDSSKVADSLEREKSLKQFIELINYIYKSCRDIIFAIDVLIRTYNEYHEAGKF